MDRQEKAVLQILSDIGVTVNGSNPWDINIKDKRLYARALRDKNLGLGEAYMEGWWDCDQIDNFIYRLLTAKIDKKIKGTARFLFLFLTAYLFNLQSRSRSHMIADHHYNLGNDLFHSFLDSYKQYSCGYFNGTDDLERAQIMKLDLLCKKLHLTYNDKVLDIGCGWGGFAKYAAEHYGCSVTAVNISTEQIAFAQDFCKGLPVKIIKTDYRNISESFDKIVSVGMFEHVGQKNYRTFMKVIHRCLNNGGIFLLHTIGGNSSRINCDPWITKYVFPNGMLPSIKQIGKACEGLFVMEDWHNLGPHYDKTLMAWNRNFQQAWPRLKNKYDTTFKRMWEYYLLSCAAVFRSRTAQLWQIVLTKNRSQQPDFREFIP